MLRRTGFIMTNTQLFAVRELDILSKTWAMSAESIPDDKPVILEFTDELLALCEKFGNSGQSGGSAPYIAGAICSTLKHLLLQEPICPVTGIDDEWHNCAGLGATDIDSSLVWQNCRCGGLFKDSNISNGDPYYLDAIIWKGDTEGESGNDWDTFSGTVQGIRSRQFLREFPFTPKTFYIDCTRVPYNSTIHSENDAISCGDGEYVYLIKDRIQLDRVWKYYRKPLDIS